MGALETNTTLIYGVHVRESANDGSDFSNAAADYRVLFLGEDGALHLKDSSGTVTDIGSGSSTAALLGITTYAPGSDTTIGTSSSTTLVDVSAANLSVTFTAPASGNVVVKLYGLTGTTGGSGNFIRWGVRESTTIIAGPQIVDAVSNAEGRQHVASFHITGISGGSHTYKFAHAVSGNTVALYGGPTFGKGVIEVWAAPA
jgi:hypothetical protein